MLDLEALAQPAPVEPPGGPDLHYSPDYANLEREVAGKPERQIGNAIAPAEPPQWRAVVDQAQGILVRSKDLRVAAHLVRALLETQGFEGLAGGLLLVRRLVAEYWPALHPRIEAEDNNDPTARVNAIAALANREFVQAIRSSALAVSKAAGPITIKALESTDPKAGPGADALFEHVPTDALSHAAQVLTRCSQEAAALGAAWAKELPSSGPDFADLLRVLSLAQKTVSARAASRGGAGAEAAGDAPGADGSTAARPLQGEVRSRDDVVRAIDAICAYYVRAEPSSPVPLLLQRSRRLVTMSFVDILKEMLPEAVANLQKISGKTDG